MKQTSLHLRSSAAWGQGFSSTSDPSSSNNPGSSTNITSASGATRSSSSSSGSGDSSSDSGSSKTGASDKPQQGQEGTTPSSDTPLPPPPLEDVVYVGPLTYTHKLLKRISLANTAIAFAAAPAIIAYADISYVSRVGLAGTLIFFGLITTGALHWITNPYVHELRYNGATQTLDVRTATLLSRTRWDKFQLSDVQPLPWDRPVATFMARGRIYYIDVYSFPNADLLRHLTPSDVPKGYEDDKDDD